MANVDYNNITVTASNGATVTMSRYADKIASYSVDADYGTELTLTCAGNNDKYNSTTDTFTVTGNATKNYAIDDPVLTVFTNKLKLSRTGYREYTGIYSKDEDYYLSKYEIVNSKYYYMEYNVTIDRGTDTKWWAYKNFGVGFTVGTGVSSTGIMMSYIDGTWEFELRTSAGSSQAWKQDVITSATDVSAAMNDALSGTPVKLTGVRAGDFIALFVNDYYVGSCFTYQIPTLSDNGNGSIGLYSRSGIGATFTGVTVGTDQTTAQNKVEGIYDSYTTGSATQQANNMKAWGQGFTLTNGSGNVTAENTLSEGTNKITFDATNNIMENAAVQYAGLNTANYYIEAKVSGITAENGFGGCQVGFNAFGGAQTVCVFVEKISNTEGYCVRLFAPDWSLNKTVGISSGTVAYGTVEHAFATGSMKMALRRVNDKCYVYVDGVLVKTFTFPNSINASAVPAAGFVYRGTDCVITDFILYTL